MKIEHIAIWANDLEKLRLFYEKYFNGKSNDRYINEAIEYYNRLQRRALLEKKLKKESDLVKKDSMAALKDFEEIDYVD